MGIEILLFFAISIGIGYLFLYMIKGFFQYLPKFVKIILFVISLIIFIVLGGLFFQEMIIPCHSTSWLMMLEKKVDEEMYKKNSVQSVVQHIIIVHKTDTVYKFLPEKEYVVNEINEYSNQIEKLKNWKYLNYLPKYINKEEYIKYLSLSPYPLWLAMIHFRESSFKPEEYCGSYIGLGQHSPNFIRECGYTINEYKSSWKVQVYVSNEYIKKYVKRDLKSAEELYAYWLDCNWNGRKVIYHHKSRLSNGKNPYYSNKGLDKDKNKKIEIEDLSRIFDKLNNKNNFTNLS